MDTNIAYNIFPAKETNKCYVFYKKCFIYYVQMS